MIAHFFNKGLSRNVFGVLKDMAGIVALPTSMSEKECCYVCGMGLSTKN